MIAINKHSIPPVEVVERKGLGHPDTLADGISEAISQSLSRIYLEQFGQVLHHNVDKVLIIAGKSAPCFSGGRIITPPSVVVGGRATRPPNMPMGEIIENAATSYLQRAVKNLRSFRIEPRLEEGAAMLRSLMGQGANDTSIGVGYAPLSWTERLVLDLEDEVRAVPAVGEDIKLMAVRRERELTLVVAAAMVDRFISSRSDYDETKMRVREGVLRKTKRSVEADAARGEGDHPEVDAEHIEAFVNCADSGENIYLTVTGCSIEMGDDGATGRGNRGNGLITPMRPMTLEAIAGKNPVSHVGKIYNVVAQKAAGEIAEIEGVREARVTLVSKIGSPVSRPLIRSVQISESGGLKAGAALESNVNGILDFWLESTGDLVEQFVRGKLSLF